MWKCTFGAYRERESSYLNAQTHSRVMDLSFRFKNHWLLHDMKRKGRKRIFGHVLPTKNQISLRVRAGWSESSLSPRRNSASLTIQNTPSKDSDQTAQMHRLIWIFVGRTCRRYIFWRCGFNIVEYIDVYMYQGSCCCVKCIISSIVNPLWRRASGLLCFFFGGGGGGGGSVACALSV